MSPRAAARLEALGFARVHDYVAGQADWGAFGLPLAGERGSETRVGAYLRDDMPTCTLDEQLSTVRGRVSASAYDICFVVDDKRVLLGLLGRRALASDSDGAVETVMTAGPGTVRPSLAVDDARERMRRRDLSLLPVTRSDGVLMGVLRRVDFADATSSTRPAR
ncbi:MAG: CBS domain-containing protein [Actinobacteria bacterium]|nr:CBS domain-containing protein [Actinomycetota bacterium]